jgi:hypothetical protein
MKKQSIFIALFVTAIMFPFFGSISNADAQGGINQQPDAACIASGGTGPTCPGMDPPMGDPCMAAPAGPDHDACYATKHPSGRHNPVDISHCASLTPQMRPQCEAEAHGGPGPMNGGKQS